MERNESEERPIEGKPLAEVLAEHISIYRSTKNLTQEMVARGMNQLGFAEWSRPTVSEVERGRRSVSATELVGLGLVLGVPPLALLDPTSLGDPIVPSGHILIGERLLDPWLAYLWLRGLVRIEDRGLLFQPGQLAFHIELTPEGVYAGHPENLPSKAGLLLMELQEFEKEERERRRRLERRLSGIKETEETD